MLALVAGSASAFGADICSNQDGSIIYDSATTFGSSVVVVNPRLVVAGTQALIKSYSGNGNEHYGNAFCKALGMKSGVVTDIQSKSQNATMVAEFNPQGVLVGVGQSNDDFGIKTVTCQK